MATTPTIQTWRGQLGIARETTWGTAVTPSTSDQFYPIVAPKVEPIIDEIPDTGFRSLASDTFGVNQGFQYARYTFDSQAYPIPVGTLLMALQGGVDTNSPVGTHGIPQLNTGLPPSYTIQDFDATLSSGANARQMTGCYLDSLSFTYTQTGLLKTTASFVGKLDTSVVKNTAVYAADQPFVPWQNAATINALTTTGARLGRLQMDCKRTWEGWWGAGGSRDLSAASVGPISITGTATLKPVDNTDIDLYRLNTQAQMAFLFTSGTNTLTLNMQKVAFIKGSNLDRAGLDVLTMLKFKAIYNATDGGSMLPTLVNSKTTVY